MRKTAVYVLLYAITIGIIASLFVLHPGGGTPFPLLRAVIISCASILLMKYFTYMVLSPLYDIWARRHTERFAEAIVAYRPKVSVIIPAWNERTGIVHTIESVLASEYPHVEAIVINDGSTDRSDEILKVFVEEFERDPSRYPGRSLVYRYVQNGGKGAALNAGLALATGEIVMSIDADCYVEPDTIGNFVKYFADPEVMAAVGNVKIGNPRKLIGTIQYLEFLFSFYFKKADSLLNTIYIIGGAAGAFRREVFDHVGPYRTDHITEDIDLSVRIQAAGMRIIYAADAVVYTEGAADLKGLMKQRLRWKHGRFKTFWEHRSLFFRAQQGRNRLLTWLVLPLAIFGDSQLFFEIIFLVFLYAYALWAHDFSSFVSGIIVVWAMFAVQIFDGRAQDRRSSFLLLAPIGWLLFYIATFVEYNALLRSIWAYFKGHEVQWQKWRRHGVLDN